MYRGTALKDMLSRAEIYEHWKSELSGSAKTSIFTALISGLLIFLFFFLIGAYRGGRAVHIELLLPFTEDWAFNLQVFCFNVAPYLSIFNMLNLFIALVVLGISQGTSQAVREPIHWLAHLSGLQAGLNIVFLVIVVLTCLVIAVLNIVAAILMLFLGVCLFIGALSSSGN